MASFNPIPALLGGALIGFASVLLMTLTGRIAGISGILGGCFTLAAGDKGWRFAFIVGLILAPVASGLLDYPPPVPDMPASWVMITIAGLLIGFGVRLGGGCTSGHGICGIARLSARSIVATAVFMASAIFVVAINRKLRVWINIWPRVADLGHDPTGKSSGVPRYLWPLGPYLGLRYGCRARGVGDRFTLVRQGRQPVMATQYLWPTRTDIDRPLVVGSMLFGIGWGLVGLCPDPALVNLADLMPSVIVFVLAMIAGMIIRTFASGVCLRPSQSRMMRCRFLDG